MKKSETAGKVFAMVDRLPLADLGGGVVVGVPGDGIEPSTFTRDGRKVLRARARLLSPPTRRQPLSLG